MKSLIGVLALMLLASTIGCGPAMQDTVPENPAPPPGRDALITDSQG